jgi:hypothetical protein
MAEQAEGSVAVAPVEQPKTTYIPAMPMMDAGTPIVPTMTPGVTVETPQTATAQTGEKPVGILDRILQATHLKKAA